MATPLKSGIRKDYVDITTRVTSDVMTDLKHRLAPLFGGTLTAMYDIMLNTFLREKPWENGLRWRETQALSRREETIETRRTLDGKTLDVPVTKTIATGWIQINMRVTQEMAERVKSVARNNGVSPSTVLYTAVYYWIWYRNPTPDILAVRQQRRAQYKARQAAIARDAASSQD